MVATVKKPVVEFVSRQPASLGIRTRSLQNASLKDCQSRSTDHRALRKSCIPALLGIGLLRSVGLLSGLSGAVLRSL